MTDEERTALVDPRELDGFKEVQRTIGIAREQADRIPAELADRGQLGEATDALKALRDAVKDVEAARKREKAPYVETAKWIEGGFKELGASLDGVTKSIEARMDAFEEKERKAHEAERKRQEENERRRLKREQERIDAGKPARATPRPAPAPPPPAPPTGARGTMTKAKATPKKVWKYEIVDESLLPDEYLTKTPNRQLIGAHVRVGTQIPGVRAWQETERAVR
jgi:cell division septation protein DedD